MPRWNGFTLVAPRNAPRAFTIGAPMPTPSETPTCSATAKTKGASAENAS